MRRLYEWFLARAHVTPDFQQEMLQVFEEASARERQRGLLAYLRFCIREIAGLTANVFTWEDRMTNKRLPMGGALAGLLIAAAITAAWYATPYTSIAVLRMAPGPIPGHVVPARPMEPAERAARDALTTVTSRAWLTKIIESHNLYRDEVKEDGMEHVVNKVRTSIYVEAGPPIRISFKHPDPVVAQKVTESLVTAILEQRRERTTVASMTTRFMQDQLKAAAAVWRDKIAAVETARAGRERMQQLRAEADLARQRYESLSAKASAAELATDLERRQQGAGLELVLPPSKPVRVLVPRIPAESAWFVAGALAGWLISLFVAKRRAGDVLKTA